MMEDKMNMPSDTKGKEELSDDDAAQATGGIEEREHGYLFELYPLDLRPPCPNCGGTGYDFDRASTECPDYFDAECMSCGHVIEVTPWNGNMALFCSKGVVQR